MINLNPWLNAPNWYIAYSGGLDSTVLLHLLADYARNHASPVARHSCPSRPANRR